MCNRSIGAKENSKQESVVLTVISSQYNDIQEPPGFNCSEMEMSWNAWMTLFDLN